MTTVDTARPRPATTPVIPGDTSAAASLPEPAPGPADGARVAGTPPALRVDALTLRRSGRLVIDGVDCTLAAGTIGAVVGPNGAGKSTLLALAAGILRADAGAVTIDGADLSTLPRRSRARQIALAAQRVEGDVSLSAFEVVLLARIPHLPRLGAPGARDRAVATSALRRVGATHLADRRFAELSGGERQRVLLARAVAQEPALLLLDEPLNNLDIHAKLETLALMRALAGGGLTILTALHDLSLAAAHADTVIVMTKGRVRAAGRPHDILTPGLIAEVYGVHADVLTAPDGRRVIAFAPLPLEPGGVRGFADC